MQTKKIESNILLFIIIRSIFLLFFFKESLLNIILGSLVGFILIIITKKLKLKNNLLIKIILIIFLLYSSILILEQITNFIEYNILQEYPLFIIGFSFILISLLLSLRGYHSYIKSLELSSYIIAFLGIISFFLLFSNIDLSNFNIQLKTELIINQNFLYLGILLFIGYFIINYLNNYQLNKKIYFGSILSTILLKLLTVSILGETLLTLYDYPFISIFKRIKYLDFIERMEGILSLQYLFDFFLLFTLVLLTIKILIVDIFKIKKDKIINFTLSFISLIIFLLAYIIA